MKYKKEIKFTAAVASIAWGVYTLCTEFGLSVSKALSAASVLLIENK